MGDLGARPMPPNEYVVLSLCRPTRTVARMSRITRRPRSASGRPSTATAALAVAAAVALVVPALSTPVLGSSAVASATAAERTPERNLTATAHDLGTLGGKYSRAEAVDGSIVVGWSNDEQRKRHAFAYDLAAADPTMIDLGTLGGNNSYAEAVAGSIVVGTSTTASGETHAFAYDLAADEPTMVDLGTLGTGSRANAVDGSMVVGISQTVSGEAHAFAYDLAADEPAMIDLGVLEGGRVSEALDVDGRYVVGYSQVPSDDPYDSSQRHAFVYDLDAAEPAMRDLGTLGGRESFARAVDGTVVVGWSYTTDNPEHAFAYDLAATEPTMLDLGTLPGGGFSEAVDVDDNVVAGWSYTEGANKRRAFTYDLDAPAMRELPTVSDARGAATGIDGNFVIQEWRKRGDHAVVHDLGSDDSRSLSLGNWRGSDAVDVDGDVVVGSAYHGSASRATAWVLRRTTRPMLAFRHLHRGVKESTGRVRIAVTRHGRTDRAVSVRYRTRSDGATAGKDFTSTSGKLHFPRGVTRRSFTVKIVNDRRTERAEYLVLELSHPTTPAVLGTPSWSNLRINANTR